MGKIVGLILFVLFSLSCSQDKVYQELGDGFENQTFVAKVIRIIDGDTMEVLYKNTPIKIRLAHIDCPEKRGSQPFGNEAKKTLSDLCFGQNVTIYGEEYDRYKRLVAVIVNAKKETVNMEMIKQDLAWHFKRYSTDQVYARLELKARENKIGIWQDPNPIPPWEWRELKHHVIKGKNSN